MRVRASFWTMVALAAIVFGAGLGGTWLGHQVEPGMPWLWGWFGAIVAGVALFGAVGLVAEGRKVGWLVLAVVGGAAIVMDMQFFGATHDPTTALLLGVFPTLLAVAAGVVEVQSQQAEQQRNAAHDAEQKQHVQAEQDAERTRVQVEREMAERERAAERAFKLEMRRAELEAELNARHVQVEQGRSIERPAFRIERSIERGDVDVVALVERDPTLTVVALADLAGCSTGTVSSRLKRAGLMKVDGQWARAEMTG